MFDPEKLIFVKDLECFYGPLLTEWKNENGNIFVEKYCTESELSYTTLFVQSTEQLINDFLNLKISMFDLSNHTTGFLVVCLKNKNDKKTIEKVNLSTLPKKFISKNGFHSIDLRPENQ